MNLSEQIRDMVRGCEIQIEELQKALIEKTRQTLKLEQQLEESETLIAETSHGAADRITELERERDQAEKRIISSTEAFKRIAQAHLAALRAGNGDAAEIARLAAYVEPQQGDLSAAILNLRCSESNSEDFLKGFDLARANAASLAASQHKAGVQIPEGWQLVPKSPTNNMIMAGYYPELKANQRTEMYMAMLAAAPQPAQQEGGNG